MFPCNAKGSGGQTLEQKVVDFPVDPRELPNCAAIYKDDEPQSLDEQNILQHKAPPLRKSNRMVRPAQTQAVVPTSSSTVPTDPTGFMQQMMMFTQFMQHQQQQQQGQQQGGSEVLHLLKPNARRQKALMPPPPPGEEAVVTAPEIANAEPAEPAAPAAAPAVPATSSVAPPPVPIAPPPTPKASAAATLTELDPLDPEELERKTDGHKDAAKKRPATTQQVASKARANSKAKAAAKASGKAKAGGKAGSKAKACAKSGLKPVVDRKKYKGGWTVEVRQRPTGQRDKSYIGPDGRVYRMQHEAESAGFVAK